MVHAFVMVKTTAGASEALLKSITAIHQVDEAHIVAGDYDIIAELDAEEVYGILETVSNALTTLDGVVDTRTYIALN
ncbi:MAG: Lrp/AsnC ligand binding domain-containing protein [Natrialbaceae archaeon]|nr:Lrp/AsnC ligand binding domain-containing protein [Natrialbaceae archaeon]